MVARRASVVSSEAEQLFKVDYLTSDTKEEIYLGSTFVYVGLAHH